MRTLGDRVAEQLSGAARYLFPFLSSTLTVAAGLFLILVLAIYIGGDPALYREGILHLFPHGSRERASAVLARIAIVLRKWLVTQLIAMLVIGVVSTITLLLLDVKAAIALGVIAGLLEFVPTIGPIMSAVPAIAMGFLDSPQKALAVGLAYLVIQQLEGHLLIPMLMKEGMDLPPRSRSSAQAVMALLFGFLGLMVAVPLLAVIMFRSRCCMSRVSSAIRSSSLPTAIRLAAPTSRRRQASARIQRRARDASRLHGPCDSRGSLDNQPPVNPAARSPLTRYGHARINCQTSPDL